MNKNTEHRYSSSSNNYNDHSNSDASVNFLYQCMRCTFKSNYLNTFRVHAVEHGSTFYSCDFCAFETNRQELFLVHKETHSDQKKYFCSKCGYKTCIPASILRHKCMKVQCSKCPLILNSISKMKLHFFSHLKSKPNKFLRNYEDESVSLYCGRKYCKKKANFKEEKSLLTDATSTQLKELYTYPKSPKMTCEPIREIKIEQLSLKCSMCDFEAKSKGSLKLHSLLHNKKSTFKCSQCDYVTDFRNLFELHEETHAVSGDIAHEEKYLRSPGANKRSKNYDDDNLQDKRLRLEHSKSNLLVDTMNHNLKVENSVHLNGSYFSCSVCKFNSVVELDYLDHINTHNVDGKVMQSLKRTKYQCCLCDYETNMIVIYKDHLMERHGKNLADANVTSRMGAETNIKTSVKKIMNEKFKDSQNTSTLQNANSICNSGDKPSDVNCRELKRHCKQHNNLKRQYLSWSIAEKREIYWCHLYAKKSTTGVRFGYKRRNLLEERGVMDKNKLNQVSDQKLQSMVAVFRMGKGGLPKEDMAEMEKEVSEYIERKSTESEVV